MEWRRERWRQWEGHCSRRSKSIMARLERNRRVCEGGVCMCPWKMNIFHPKLTSILAFRGSRPRANLDERRNMTWTHIAGVWAYTWKSRSIRIHGVWKACIRWAADCLLVQWSRGAHHFRSLMQHDLARIPRQH